MQFTEESSVFALVFLLLKLYFRFRLWRTRAITNRPYRTEPERRALRYYRTLTVRRRLYKSNCEAISEFLHSAFCIVSAFTNTLLRLHSILSHAQASLPLFSIFFLVSFFNSSLNTVSHGCHFTFSSP